MPGFRQATLKTIALGLLLGGGGLISAPLSHAGESWLPGDGVFEATGFIGFDLRLFPQDAIHTGQRDQHLNPSVVLQPEFSYEWNDGDDRIDFIPFARLDPQDDERRHFDIRELKYLHIDDGWDLRVGIDKVFWGVTESRHLVDIVNQTDAVEAPDGEDKLGQPLINLGIQSEYGDFNFITMPYFRERTFPDTKGRLRSSIPVDTDRAVYDNDLEELHPDFAVRYSAVLGDWDIGLANFYGTSREPRLVFDPDNSVLVPHYDIINQTSADIQATYDAWLWKLESIYRTGQGDDFHAVSGGFEYTFFGVVGDYGDLGLLVEYHYDDRDETAPGTIFDDDIFVGTRITLNDEDDTDFLAGVVVDRLNQGRSFLIEADTRLNDNMTLEAELNISDNISRNDLLFDTRQDDFAEIRLNYYF